MEKETPKMIDNGVQNFDEMIANEINSIFKDIADRTEKADIRLMQVQNKLVISYLKKLRKKNPNVHFKMSAIPVDNTPYLLSGIKELIVQNGKKVFYILQTDSDFDLPIDYGTTFFETLSWKNNDLVLNNIDKIGDFKEFIKSHPMPEKLDFILFDKVREEDQSKGSGILIAVIGGYAKKIPNQKRLD